MKLARMQERLGTQVAEAKATLQQLAHEAGKGGGKGGKLKGGTFLYSLKWGNPGAGKGTPAVPTAGVKQKPPGEVSESPRNMVR